MTDRAETDVAVPAGWGKRWRRTFTPVRQPGGGVERLEIGAGHIEARVRDPSGQRMQVTVDVAEFDDDQWQRLVDRLVGRLRHAAELLAGRVPERIEDVAEDVDLVLFPEEDEVVSACDCGQAPSCPHAGAVHRAVGEALSGDPSQLLTLRGRDRETLLIALRAARAGAEPEAVARQVRHESLEFEELDLGAMYAGGDLDAVRLHPAESDDPAALLRRLGEPPQVEETGELERLVGVAADTAWKLAAGEGSQTADDELLLAELRARGMATGTEVAEALGWPTDRAIEVLDRLYEEGTILRSGSGEGAMYRA